MSEIPHLIRLKLGILALLRKLCNLKNRLNGQTKNELRTICSATRDIWLQAEEMCNMPTNWTKHAKKVEATSISKFFVNKFWALESVKEEVGTKNNYWSLSTIPSVHIFWVQCEKILRWWWSWVYNDPKYIPQTSRWMSEHYGKN